MKCPFFDDTTHSVCSFAFRKMDSWFKNKEHIDTTFFPSNDRRTITLEEQYKYRIGGQFWRLLEFDSCIKVERLKKGNTPNSHLTLRATDSGSEHKRIKLYLKDKQIYSINGDETLSTIRFVNREPFSAEQEKLIAQKFNYIVEKYRTRYNSLFLSNYRNSTDTYSRKRISIKTAFKLIEYIIMKYI